MQAPGSSDNHLLDELKAISNRLSETDAIQKIALLKACAKRAWSSSKQLIRYHDCLLFLLAYPQTADLYDLAKQELERVCDLVKHHSRKLSFDRSGLAYAETQGAFSLELTQWLLARFPGQVLLHSISESSIHPQKILKHTLPAMEYELAADDGLKPLKWLEKAAGTKHKGSLLQWIADQFSRLDADSIIREQLFESLGLFISIVPSDPTLSRSFGRSIPQPVFYHQAGLLKTFDPVQLLNTAISPRKKLSVKEDEHVISASRIALAMLNRETDPITYCKPGQLEYYELERGLSIALFSINTDRRLPLESYIGYMLFKNGQPMAYGGCWVFGARALAGVNIFDAFRGGESAYVFCSILRVYRQRFGISYFEVEPYQFGKGNPEGIQSGAFWFYYRFGFRPLDPPLAKLAEQEQESIQADKTYRSSYNTLKAFTRSNIGWHIGQSALPQNPTEISKAISAHIVSQFKGDRATAEQAAFKAVSGQLGITSQRDWTADEKLAFRRLCLWLYVCVDLSAWTSAKKQKLVECLRLKGWDEFAYIDVFRKLFK